MLLTMMWKNLLGQNTQKPVQTEKAKAAPIQHAEVKQDIKRSLLDDFIEAIGTSPNLNVDQVLSMILARARRATGAEAGSIFISRPVTDDPNMLRACSLQNDRIEVETQNFEVQINALSIAGYVASRGELVNIDDLYDLPPEAPYSFNRSFDDKHGYRSKTMLAFPLKNFQGRVIGVVQLINRITGVDNDGIPKYGSFTLENIDDMQSVLTILGVMVERIDLLSEIDRLKKELGRG